MLEGLKTIVDMSTLAMTARAAENYSNNHGYDKLAFSLEKQVLRGACDPVAAEAALNDYSVARQREDFSATADAERGAKALERLVSIGILDPLFAENVLIVVSTQ